MTALHFLSETINGTNKLLKNQLYNSLKKNKPVINIYPLKLKLLYNICTYVASLIYYCVKCKERV